MSTLRRYLACRLKRAGLDYWPKVVVKVHEDWQHFQQHWEAQTGPKRLHAFTKFSQRNYALPGILSLAVPVRM